MAKMKTGRTTSITTPPPSDYKKYQADSTQYERLNKEFKELPNKNKYFGEGGFGKLRRLNPADQKKVYALQDKFASNQLKDSITHVGSYETDAQFMERFTNMTDPTSQNWTSGSGRPGAILKKPVKPKQVIDPSKTKKSVTPKVVAVTPKETIAKTTVITKPKEDMTLPSKMAIKKPGLIKTEKQELQGELEKSPEYTSSTPIASRPVIKYNKGRDLGVTVGTSNAKMFGIRRNEVTPIGAKIVQKLTGYSKTDELDKDESGRVIFQGASGFKELKAQKKYNKEFDKYQAKQDEMKAYSSMFNNAANRNTIESQISKLKKP
jgi:hypothetical protein